MSYVKILACLMCRFVHVLCADVSMSYVNCSPNGLAVRLAPSVQHPYVYIYIYIYIFCAQSTIVQRPVDHQRSFVFQSIEPCGSPNTNGLFYNEFECVSTADGTQGLQMPCSPMNRVLWITK